MINWLSKSIFLLLGIIGTIGAHAQKPENRNAIKVDVISPAFYQYLPSGEYERRGSVEFERMRMDSSFWDSYSIDGEYISSYHTEDNPRINRYRYREFSISGGARKYFWKGPFEGVTDAGLFVEPRIAITLLRFRHFSTYNGIKTEKGFKLANTPRLKLGWATPLFQNIRIGIEVEGIVRRFTLPPFWRLDYFPELNIGIKW